MKALSPPFVKISTPWMNLKQGMDDFLYNKLTGLHFGYNCFLFHQGIYDLDHWRVC